MIDEATAGDLKAIVHAAHQPVLLDYQREVREARLSMTPGNSRSAFLVMHVSEKFVPLLFEAGTARLRAGLDDVDLPWTDETAGELARMYREWVQPVVSELYKPARDATEGPSATAMRAKVDETIAQAISAQLDGTDATLRLYVRRRRRTRALEVLEKVDQLLAVGGADEHVLQAARTARREVDAAGSEPGTLRRALDVLNMGLAGMKDGAELGRTLAEMFS